MRKTADKAPDRGAKTKVNPAKKGAGASRVTRAQVLAFLMKNPNFLVEQAGALGQLSLPKKGGNILSLHAAKADKATDAAAKMAQKNRQLVAIAASNAAVAESIFGVVLDVVGCGSLGALRSYFQAGLLARLEVDAARLFTVGAKTAGNTLAVADAEEMCPGPVVLRSLTKADERGMYGPKGKMMGSDCLLQLRDGAGVLRGVLALGSRDPARYHAGQSTELAAFLGQLIGLRLGQLL